ncbi:MAG TPA: peptide ABC transporter substrate-binding protein [Methylomirabilota bacterium]|nr:peptide ABC transporter substrate-binding protein [Methylomirabilota bacterium]
MRNFWGQIKDFLAAVKRGISQIRDLKKQQIPHLIETFSKKELYILVAALLFVCLSGGFLLKSLFSQGSNVHNGGEITEGLVGQPQFINPILAQNNNVDSDLSRIVYAQLLKYDDAEDLRPDLAQDLPTISADQKTFTLKLKPNLKWQDGKPLTADDVLFTIQTIQNADFSSPLRPNWIRVKVTKVDDLTLTFTLREVSVSFINNFALGILPQHIWGSLSAQDFRLADANLKPIGSGPFKISEIQKISDKKIKSLSLVPNSNYYQGRPYLDEITFKFFDSMDDLINAYQGRTINSLGFVAFDSKAFLAASDKYTQYRVDLPQYQAVFFNLIKNSPVAEKAVRQALWLTTNRDEIINQAYANQVAADYTPILPGSLGFNANIEKTVHNSLEEAGGILDKAGWNLDPTTGLRMKNGKPLEFNLAVNGSLILNVKTAQILLAQWEKLGLKVDLVLAAPDELEQNYIRPRQFDALLFSENIGADPDPYPFWHSSLAHDPGLNFSGFSNPEADKLLTEARQTNDGNIRTQDYLRFQEIINDELPAIFLVRSLYIYNVPKKIQGINLNEIIEPSDRFLDINKWYVTN